jgi:hypothetical protein
MLSTALRSRRLDAVLENTRFWNRANPEKWVDPHGITPGGDVLLQCREEFIQLCKFIDRTGIRSFLEIGIWTGALSRSLDYIFEFEERYAADLLDASKRQNLPVILPDDTVLFIGSTESPAFERWMQRLPRVDMCFIDGDHSYEGVARDFKICKAHQPSAYLVLHDIVGWWPGLEGVKKFWNELEGQKVEYIYSVLGIGIWGAGNELS